MNEDEVVAALNNAAIYIDQALMEIRRGDIASIQEIVMFMLEAAGQLGIALRESNQ